ncbi:hypothetical protein ASZ90_017661 [hydrocarbon metagenome]|uniref:Uncharacterized protein n=1 Tax=hydrocarbon metagenome TaxID=938273 RepID=A0A0W8E8G8_9ZZZZ
MHQYPKFCQSSSEYTQNNVHNIQKGLRYSTIIREEAKVISEEGSCCMVLQEIGFQDAAGHGKINFERIMVNEMGQESIRLSYLEKNSQGLYQTVSRPLEAVEDDIFEIIKKGIESRVISPVLQAGLKTVIRNTVVQPVPWKPIRTAQYCDIYARGEVLACGHTISMERIFIKGLNVFNIRLAVYRKNPNGFWAMVLSPVSMSEEEFLYLFQDSMKKGVFSKVFVIASLSLL